MMIKFSILLLTLSTISFSAFSGAPVVVGSPEWCAKNKICNDPADGPDEGSEEIKYCRAKGGCKVH